MANKPCSKFLDYYLLVFTIIFASTAPTPNALSSCNGPCTTLNDCKGQLLCIGGKCNDDPDVGTHICGGSGGRGGTLQQSSGCQPSGSLVCNGRSFPKYYCSPPVTSSTKAKLTLNHFGEGEEGGDKSECDDSWHEKWEKVVALSTGWFNKRSRCGKMIKITAQSGRSVLAKVVDECDSKAGCDEEHAYQPPCGNNVVDGSDAVWDALGLDKRLNNISVTWSMA